MRATVLVIALLMMCGVGLANPSHAAAAAPDQLRDDATVTYQLVPARHVIHVTVKATLTNKKPGTSTQKGCTGWAFDPWYGWYSYSTTCTYKTSYYYYSSSYWVEADAKALTVKANSGTAKLKAGKVNGGWRDLAITYSPIYYGQTRTITYAYDLPASGPRGTASRRAGAATAEFCAYGPGSDSGEVRVVMPAGYVIDGATSLKQISTKGSTWTWSSGRLASKPWDWHACITGANPKGTATTPVTSSPNPISNIAAWTDDPVWTAAATTAASDAGKLEAVLGPAPDGEGITLAEAASGEAPFYPYSVATKRITLAETVTSTSAFDDAVAEIWLPESIFGSGWLHAGYRRWAEATAGVAGATCTKPASAVSLDTWVMAASTGSTPQGAEQLNAACWIVTQVANTIGPDRMRATMATIRAGTTAWSSGSTQTKPKGVPVTWHDWLDIVTSQGLMPAGADPNLAADLLTTYGIAKPADGLADRAKAIAGLSDLQTTTGGHAPASILPAIAGWDFAGANAAIAAANRAWSTADTVPTILKGTTIEDGPVRKAVTAAATQADLDAAVALADQQVALAKHVSEAIALEAAPRDTVQQVGLLGTTFPSDATAVSAVTAVDAGTANATADQIISTVNGAHDAGMQRIVMAVASLVGALLLVLVAVFLLRRRGRRRVALASPSASIAVPELAPEAPPTAGRPEGDTAMEAAGPPPPPDLS